MDPMGIADLIDSDISVDNIAVDRVPKRRRRPGQVQRSLEANGPATLVAVIASDDVAFHSAATFRLQPGAGLLQDVGAAH